MLKTLVTINSFGVRNLASLAYLMAWKRFLDRNARYLDCDFIFVNNCLNQDILVSYLAPYQVLRLKDYSAKDLTTPFDTENSYWPIKVLGKNYQYILRVDHDAFPTLASLQTLIEEPSRLGADFVSASNYPRPIEHDRTYLKELDNRFTSGEKRKSWSWFPWGYPTHNSDLFVMRYEFFKEVDTLYALDPHIKKIQSIQCPFATTILTYGQLCNIMRVVESRYEDTGEVKIHIDGSINSDWWTYMCSLQPRYVGIVNHHGESFATQNHINKVNQAMQFAEFEQVRDEKDISYPHKEIIHAPYFHLGSGYLAEWYLTPRCREMENTYLHISRDFESPPFGSYVAHYAITSMFTDRCKEKSVRRMKRVMQKQVISQTCKDIPAFSQYVNNVCEFYSKPLVDYL